MGDYVFLYELTPEVLKAFNQAGAGDAVSSSGGVFDVLRAINKKLDHIFPDFARVLETRITYFSQLKEKRVLKSGGPFFGFTGGMFIFEAPNLEAARSIVENDPLYLHSYIRKDYIVREWYNLFDK